MEPTTASDQVVFDPEELLSSHPIEQPLFAGGVRCHGGFDADGKYVSPRTATRGPAIAAWQRRHTSAFGTELLDVGLDAFPGQYPNLAQTRLLLDGGITQPLISELTRIGTVEGFGAMIRFSNIPDWGTVIDEDITGTSLAHLDRGLFEAHARDESGFEGEGGHQQMWYAARDIAFDHPATDDQTAVMLERMGLAKPGRGQQGVDLELMARQFEERRLFRTLDWQIESLLERMIRLMMIEISAFHIFAWAEEILADTDRIAGDGEAARLVSYIRSDETPHIEYLKTALTELRDRTFVGDDGVRIPGAEVIGAMWDRALAESRGGRRSDFLDLTIGEVTHALADRHDADDLLEQFHALGDVRPDADGTWIDVTTGDRA
ncbi:MAG TPA: hypothetical protein VGA13_07435 [Acidimicrobiales bacterium]|jgi:hypothetical protein